MSNDGKLRVGVIGTGAFAEACHMPGLLSHPRAEVVAICGRQRAKAQALADRFGVALAVTDPVELCARDDLDAVSICTPNAVHGEQALLAFRHGKHVFCEKPLAPTMADAAVMARAANESGRIHQVAFTYRHLYGVEELRRRVKAGEVGEPILLRANHEYRDGLNAEAAIGWRHRSGSAGGGVLQDSGSHLIDLARFVLGPITAVRADLQFLVRPGVESDDMATVWFRCASGVSGQWFASRVTPPRSPNSVQIVGREGMLEALISRGGVDAVRRARPGAAAWEDVSLPDEARDGQPHALGRMMRSFVDACLQGRLTEGAASFDDGLAVQRISAAAEESAGADWTRLDPAA
jgi:predicted dehydrogenase